MPYMITSIFMCRNNKKGLLSNYGVMKLGGGCLETIIAFVIIWLAYTLITCYKHSAKCRNDVTFFKFFIIQSGSQLLNLVLFINLLNEGSKNETVQKRLERISVSSGMKLSWRNSHKV